MDQDLSLFTCRSIYVKIITSKILAEVDHRGLPVCRMQLDQGELRAPLATCNVKFILLFS